MTKANKYSQLLAVPHVSLILSLKHFHYIRRASKFYICVWNKKKRNDNSFLDDTVRQWVNTAFPSAAAHCIFLTAYFYSNFTMIKSFPNPVKKASLHRWQCHAKELGYGLGWRGYSGRSHLFYSSSLKSDLFLPLFSDPEKIVEYKRRVA